MHAADEIGNDLSFLAAAPDVGQFATALDALSPEPYAVSEWATALSSQQFNDALMSCEERSGDARYIAEGQCLRLGLQGRHFSRNSSSDNTGYSIDTAEVSIGAQKTIAEKLAGRAGPLLRKLERHRRRQSLGQQRRPVPGRARAQARDRQHPARGLAQRRLRQCRRQAQHLADAAHARQPGHRLRRRPDPGRACRAIRQLVPEATQRPERHLGALGSIDESNGDGTSLDVETTARPTSLCSRHSSSEASSRSPRTTSCGRGSRWGSRTS